MPVEQEVFVKSLLSNSQIEIFPMRGVEERLAFIAPDLRVSVACMQSKGLDATVELCAKLKESRPERTVIAHLPARMVSNREHLESLLESYERIGVDELFVIGGDAAEACGEYAASAPLVKDIAESGKGFKIGVAAYPEPHPTISPQAHIDDLLSK